MKPKPMTIIHQGKPFELPFIVHQASSANLYSLFDYEAACSLCEKENYKPIIINTPEGGKKAAGFVAAIDYKKTSAVPYVEWSLGIFVIPNEQNTPEVDFINETSLFFQSIMDNEIIGNTVFCPKLVLNESLPTEIGFEYYGYPKEVGEVNYKYDQQVSTFSVSTREGQLIMKALFPTKRGILAKFGLIWAMFRAYNFRLVLQSLSKKEFIITLVGSAKILGKKAHMKIKNDPNTEMFPWNIQDCHLEINPESKWGKVVLNLQLQPMLVCHVPNLKFELSEPIDQ
ncbi:MAG: hypothetical protein PHI06_12835 [Desulfobulbaceae bacterium]|nr:hypothetical protein [Desulfobulbaceae bacterium]